MQRFSFKFRIIVGSCFLLQAATNAIAQTDICQEFGKYGIYDYQSSTSDSARASSYRRLFCKQNFKTAESANDFHASLGVTLPAEIPIPLDFSAGKSDKEFKSSYDKYCDDNKYTDQERTKTEIFVKKISTEMVSLMKECTRLHSKGLKFWLTQDAGPDSFEFHATFVPDDQETHVVTIEHFIPENATCRLTPTEVSPAGFNTQCFVIDKSRAVTWTIKASKEYHWLGSSTIQPVVETVVTPPPPRQFVRLVELTRSGTLPMIPGGIQTISNERRRDGTSFDWGIFMDSQTDEPASVEYAFDGKNFTVLRTGGFSQLVDSCPSSILGSVSLTIEGRKADKTLVELFTGSVAGPHWEDIPDIAVSDYVSILITAGHVENRMCDSLALIEPVLQEN